MTLNHAARSGQHPHADRGLDLYETPAVAVEALLCAETLPHRIWEPAAGRGAIVEVLRNHDHDVVASDIVRYEFPLDFESDFLAMTEAPPGVEAIIGNPPYQHADRFVRHALDLAPTVVMLLRLAFLESIRRTELENRGLVCVHVFRNRLPLMHRDGWTGPRASSAIAFGWYCWDRSHRGPATIDRISWSR